MAEVRRAAESLAASRARAAVEVAAVLDGWHGVAGGAFAEAWSGWLHSARSVESSLSGLADALALFHTDISAVDADSASTVARLAGRLS